MSVSDFIQYVRYLHAAYLSRPAEDRVLYRAVRKARPQSIVEIGVRGADRTLKLIQMASRYAEGEIRYTGIDLFEQRPADRPPLTLKTTHRLLKKTGAKVQLAPGDPFMALARYANMLTNTDLVIISGEQDADALSRAWFYLPRMLHDHSQVFEETGAGDKKRFETIPLDRIRRQASQRRAA